MLFISKMKKEAIQKYKMYIEIFKLTIFKL